MRELNAYSETGIALNYRPWEDCTPVLSCPKPLPVPLKKTPNTRQQQKIVTDLISLFRK